MVAEGKKSWRLGQGRLGRFDAIQGRIVGGKTLPSKSVPLAADGIRLDVQ